jgi:dTDP-glucose 4,6-dehydratase
MKYIITGGQGFIGINLAKYLLSKNHKVLTIDKMSYASNSNILKKKKNFLLKKVDICKTKEIKKIFFKFRPDFIYHLAAESHVDNSILNSEPFIETNILGTYSVLKSFHEYQSKINSKAILVNISTDEVFGSITRGEFKENNRYLPNSPYSASKASADHLVRAWNKTFKTRVITTNCSNNFGPYQNKEKLIPKIINNIIKDKPVPVYGNGLNQRDWIYVKDHAEILYKLSKEGKIGETYNIGTKNVVSNIKIINDILKIYNQKFKKKKKLKEVIEYVEDRKGHDFRYAIDNSKIKKLLKLKNKNNFKKNLIETFDWYLELQIKKNIN